MIIIYRVELCDLLTGKKFFKDFGSPYLLDKFLKKIKYSKRIKVYSWCRIY